MDKQVGRQTDTQITSKYTYTKQIDKYNDRQITTHSINKSLYINTHTYIPTSPNLLTRSSMRSPVCELIEKNVLVGCRPSTPSPSTVYRSPWTSSLSLSRAPTQNVLGFFRSVAESFKKHYSFDYLRKILYICRYYFHTFIFYFVRCYDLFILIFRLCWHFL